MEQSKWKTDKLEAELKRREMRQRNGIAVILFLAIIVGLANTLSMLAKPPV